MRKFALLFAFVLVMACAGGAFATPIALNDVTVADIKARLDPTINKIRTLATAESFTITDSATQQLDAEDYKWIYRALFDSNLSPTADPVALNASATFTLVLGAAQTDIPPGAFKYQGYKGMTTLTVGTNKVKTIGANAFEGTESLTTLTTLFTNTALVEIGQDAFKDSAYNSVVTISNPNFTKIGTGAFAGSKITSFTLSATDCTEIPANAFNGCGLLTSVTLTGSGVKTIGEKAFYDCDTLATLTLGVSGTNSKLEKIGKSAFENCKASGFATLTLTSAKKLTEIGDAAFRGCLNLTALTGFGGTKLTTIGDYAFADTAVGDDGTGGLPFPTTLKNVGKGAFDYYSAFQGPVTPLTIVFRSGTDESADRRIMDAAGVRAFLETLNMTGAFGVSDNDRWPLAVVDNTTISIGYNGNATPDNLNTILNVAQGPGGIVDDPNNADTKAIVGILKGMGFRTGHIVTMLTDGSNRSALSEATVAAIAATGPSGVVPVTHDRDDLDMLLIRADDLAKTTIGPAVGQLPQDKAALLETLKNAIAAANKEYADGKLPLPTSIVDSNIWNALDTATSNVGNNIVQLTPPPPVKSDDNRSGGSTGGSGGCAAGFAPMAALFVLGAALKLRKGR